MTKNPKIILNRAKKGKILSVQEQEILFQPIVGHMTIGIKYVNDVLETRLPLFEQRFKEYCISWNSMWGINEGEIMFYIKKRIKGPWNQIEKYFSDPFLQTYRIFLEENNFQEHLI